MKRKYILSSLALAALALGNAGCTDDFEEVNTNTNKIYEVELNDVFAGTIQRTANNWAEMNYRRFLNFSRLSIVMFCCNPSQDTGDGYFRKYYVDVLRDLINLERKYDETLDSDSRTIYPKNMAIVKIWKSYVFYVMASCWGPIPMSDAIVVGNEGKRYYAYDSEEKVYSQILDELKAAVDLIDHQANASTLDALDYDPIFGEGGLGAPDMDKWLRFANTLRLNVAMHCQNLNAELSRGHALEALADGRFMESNDQNAILTWDLDAENSASYYYTSFQKNHSAAQGGEAPLWPCLNEYGYIYFSTFSDPRMPKYVRPMNDRNPNAKPFLVTDTITRLHSNYCKNTDTKDASGNVIATKCPNYSQHRSLPSAVKKTLRDSIIVRYTVDYAPYWEQVAIPSTWNWATVPGYTYSYNDPLTAGRQDDYNHSVAQPYFVGEDAHWVILTYADACFLRAEAELLYNNDAGAAKAAHERRPQVVADDRYPTTDVKVVEMNILDYQADANQGAVNVTSIIQQMLNALGDASSYPSGSSQAYRKTGGTLYLPAGTYKVDGRIVIPRGVTLRGDWKQPVKGEPIEGTIISVTSRYANDTTETNACFIMEPSTRISDVAIWYATQRGDAPIAYPPSIVMGRQGYFGNDYCNVRNVTLVNSYIGVIFSELNGGGCPNIFHLYGTPLHKGITMDNIADVGRFDHIDFSPKYWAGSGLANAADATQHTYNNATGFEMRRNDWSYCCNYSAEGYSRGFWAKKSPDHMAAQSTGSPNGHNYNLTFTDCRTGIYMTESAGCGIMFTRVSTPGCEIGLEQAAGDLGPSQFLACSFSGSRYGVFTHADATQTTQLHQCSVVGGVGFEGGQLIADQNTFSGNVEIGEMARCVFVGNKFTSGELVNNSLFECRVDNNSGFAAKGVPEYAAGLMEVKPTKPAKADLFLASSYGAVGVYIDPEAANHGEDASHDNAPAIQQALDAAGSNGGGIVYLTPGHYRCNSALSIPAGVELRGASDLASVPRGQGAVLEVYCGEGSEAGSPFITMAAGSGLRGITINYPNQDGSTFTDVAGGMVDGSFVPAHAVCTPKKYPYAIRGNADTYIVNLGLRACYRGIDMFTNKCDNHYVDYISGHCFKNVVRIGGMSEGGTVSNIQCNTIALAAGDEWKYGLWPNSLHNATATHQEACYQQNYDELEFMVIGDCRNENLYNNFLFGSWIGILFQSDGQGGATVSSLGNAVDGVVNTFVLRAAAADVEMTNSQLVALNNGHSANFFTTEAAFNRTVNMFNTNNWGGGDTFANVAGGTVNFVLAALQQNGEKQTFLVDAGGKLSMANFNVRSNNKNANGNSHVSLYNGVFTPLNADGSSFNTALFGAYSNILPLTWALTNRSGFKDRSSWHVIAFNDLLGKIYDENGKLVEGASLRNYVEGSTLQDLTKWDDNEFYERNPGDATASRATDNDMTTRWSTKGSQNPFGWYDENAGDETETSQSWNTHPMQWYAVYFSQDLLNLTRTEHINAIILDASNNPNDGPASWQLQVLDDNSEEQVYSPEKTPDDAKKYFKSTFGITLDDYILWEDDRTDELYGHHWRTVAKGAGAGSLLIASFPEEDVRGVRILQTGTKGGYWSIDEVYAAMIEGLANGVEEVELLNAERNLFFADGTLIIASSLFDAKGCAMVEIYDLAGRKVQDFTATTGRVDINGLQQGVYVVRVGSASLKFMNRI